MIGTCFWLGILHCTILLSRDRQAETFRSGCGIELLNHSCSIDAVNCHVGLLSGQVPYRQLHCLNFPQCPCFQVQGARQRVLFVHQSETCGSMALFIISVEMNSHLQSCHKSQPESGPIHDLFDLSPSQSCISALLPLPPLSTQFSPAFMRPQPLPLPSCLPV